MSRWAVSSVLIREEDRVQHPVYYTRRALREAEMRYQKIEKVAFAIVTSTRRLRPYFQTHSIKILTDLPMRQAHHKPDTSVRFIQWSVELGELDIEYVPRTAIKAQVLAEFIAEYTCPEEQVISDPDIPT